MTKYVLTLIVVAVAGTWLLTRTTTRRQRADFVFVNRSGVFTLDPAAMSWMQDIRLALTVWEGLTSYHPQTTEPVPGSAFWPHISDDQRTYTFTIRPHARWSNGQPVTAHDFVYAWRRAIEPGTAADYAFFFEHIAGVKQYVTWRHRQTEQIAQLPARLPLHGGLHCPGRLRRRHHQLPPRLQLRCRLRRQERLQECCDQLQCRWGVCHGLWPGQERLPERRPELRRGRVQRHLCGPAESERSLRRVVQLHHLLTRPIRRWCR